MGGKRIRKVLGQLGLTQVRHVSPVRVGAARGLVGQVYREVERDFGVLAPPVALHSPAPDVLAASWLMLRETLLVTGQVERTVKETVATAVSLGNSCPFCVTVHSGTLTGLIRSDDAAALANDHIDSVTDPRVRAIGAWARASSTEEGAARYRPVCSVTEAPELIGTAVLLQYLNRMVNVFLGEVPLPPGVPRVALGRVTRVLGGMIRAAAGQEHQPGAAIDLLPPAPLPADLSWATASPVVAEAFARACAAVDAAGVRSVSALVRELVSRELAGWHGEARGPSRAWAEEAISGLPSVHRSAGRLALLTALASYQIDRSVIDEFRLDRPGDDTLIELTSWASLAAARRAGGWIPISEAKTGRQAATVNETA
ncbi:MAG TPA: carboxymuconolactone decarboxylase family protein [Pseudonocardiaceae bacterium]|nr:carboxymuconolactone decarboxylase family protein [Pseudonocardiaceae bacterium]